MSESPGTGGSAPEPALFRHSPELRRTIPWVPLGGMPTPVERLDLPGNPVVWVKRDDLSAPDYGGNKVRKLEFLLGATLRQGARRLITVGAAGSHHALATTLYGRRHDLPVTLVLFPQPLTPHVREVLLADVALGAELRWAPRMEAIPVACYLARLAHRADAPAVIPAGGSNPVGTLGYVSAALELAEQVEAGMLPAPDTIHVAAGTLGTVAGLAIGLALAGLPTRIHGVRIASPLVTNERNLRRLIAGASSILTGSGLRLPSTPELMERIVLSHEAIGGGYGHATAGGTAATAALSGRLALDATYTAKAAGAMLDRVAMEADQVHLFWHTLSAAEPALPGDLPGASALPSRFRRYLAEGVATPTRNPP
jgi:1-aminocyclopropane-1-carboxylate deaminase/D-cysteine desulfhydrase-like pyridoxal-dependent ACC family enzyme